MSAKGNRSSGSPDPRQRRTRQGAYQDGAGGGVGDRIRRLRIDKGWTQEQLAEKAGVHYSLISYVERGERPLTRPVAEALAKALGLDPTTRASLLTAAGYAEDPFDVLSRLAARVEGRIIEFQDAQHSTRSLRADGPLFFGVPARPVYFKGRQELLEDLIARLVPGESLALEGMGGIGKTALAVEAVYNSTVRERFKDGVLWAGLGRQPDVMRILASWAEALGRDVSRLSTEAECSQAVRDAIGHRHILLVIEDAWHKEDADLLRCGGPNCCHLPTTRDKALADAISGKQRALWVPPLKHDPKLEDNPAYEILAELAPEACAHDPEAVRNLADTVGGLPLALILLGRYLAAPERSYFPESIEPGVAELFDPRVRLGLAQQRLGAISEPEMTLRETVVLSLEGLPQETSNTFYALGAFAPDPDWFDKRAALAVTQSDLRSLALLIARNLVVQDGDKLSLHRVVAEVAMEETRHEAVALHREYYLDLVNEDRTDWQRISNVYGQVKQAWNAATADEGLFEFLESLQWFQERRGLKRDALEWANTGLAVAEVTHRGSEAAKLLNNIGGYHYSLGEWEEALSHYQRAATIAEDVGDTYICALAMNNIALVHINTGELDKALDCLVKCASVLLGRDVTIAEEVSDTDVWICAGEHGRAVAIYLLTLAQVNIALRQPEQALQALEQSVTLLREVGDDPILATALEEFGKLHNSSGQWEKALEYHEEALAIREKAGDRASLGPTLGNIAATYRTSGDRAKALDVLRQTIDILEEVGDRNGMATALNDIGLLYLEMNEPKEAADHFRKAVPILREVGNRPVLAIALGNAAMACMSQGELSQALEYLKKALAISTEIKDWGGVGRTLNYMGQVYGAFSLRGRQMAFEYTPGKQESALAFFERQHKIAKEHFRLALSFYNRAEDQTGIAESLSNTAVTCMALGQNREATIHLRRALAILQGVNDRGLIANTLSLLGMAHNALGEPKRAQKCFRQAETMHHEIGDLE